jgi:acetyl-CoA C-acetyltransferase
MMRVAITAAANLSPGQRWEASLTDLAREVAAPIVARRSPDSLFCALPTAAALERQLNSATVVADRLGMRGATVVVGVENGDASGVAALHTACAYVRSGMARRALVLAASKTSDESEAERAEFLDCLVDQEGERALGLGYASVAGLMADLYQQRKDPPPARLPELVAADYGRACRGGDTYLKVPLSAAEIRRDLPLSSPLLRADVAPLADGACALLVEPLAACEERAEPFVEIAHLATCVQSTCVFERPSPLGLPSLDTVLGEMRRTCRSELSRLAVTLIDNPISLLEALVLEGLPPDALPSINPDGGVLGRGHVFGASGAVQAYEAFVQLSGAAGPRQRPEAMRGNASVLAIALGGLGAQAFVTLFRKGEA